MTRQTEYVRFEAARERFAVPLHKVREICNYVRVSEARTSSPYILGTYNLRNVAVPVVNLHRALGLAGPCATDPTCILLIEVDRLRGPQLIGIPVDNVYAIEAVPSQSIHAATTTVSCGPNGFGLGSICGQREDAQFILDVDWLACLLELDAEPLVRATAIRLATPSQAAAL